MSHSYNGSDTSSLSSNNTPTHSRNHSDVGMMGNLNTPENNGMSKSVGDLFDGFVISVHRKMVSCKNKQKLVCVTLLRVILKFRKQIKWGM